MNTQQQIYETRLKDMRQMLDLAINEQRIADGRVQHLTNKCLEIRREMYRMGGEVK